MVILQKIIEPMGFFLYLTIILYMCIYLYRNHNGNKPFIVFGAMAITLLLGDGILVISRLYGLLTTGIENNLTFLGLGRLAQAFIITVFYALILDLYKERFCISKKPPVEKLLLALLIFRGVITLFPQNQFFQEYQNIAFTIIRAVPLMIFSALVGIIILLHSLKNNDKRFLVLSFLLILSSIFVEPTMFFGDSYIGNILIVGLRGMLFIGIVFIGFCQLRKINELSRF